MQTGKTQSDVGTIGKNWLGCGCSNKPATDQLPEFLRLISQQHRPSWTRHTEAVVGKKRCSVVQLPRCTSPGQHPEGAEHSEPDPEQMAEPERPGQNCWIYRRAS